MRRSNITTAPPKPVEVPPPRDLPPDPSSRWYRYGECQVRVGAPGSGHGWRMLVATPGRLPTTDELGTLRYTLIPEDAAMALVFPPENQWVPGQQLLLMQIGEIEERQPQPTVLVP